MEVRKILSVIGNISTGKSSFLNYLLGSDILQTGNELKTRFIVIIRHTENNEPVLSHIKRNTTHYEDIYQKIKDSKGKIEYKGKKEIIKKISSLNAALKKIEDEGKLDYSEHLYLLETKIKNIHNQEFLYSFDLADIPGLNNNSKKEGDIIFGSIKNIFNPLKGLIQYGILVFDANQYQAANATDIIKQLISHIGIKINHFLIIFNKIDELPPEKREDAFLSFKAHLNYTIGDDLLNNTNSIIPMNTLKLLEEENVMQNFDNFLSYHFKGLTTDTYEKYFKRLVANGYYMNNKSAPRKRYSDIEAMLNPDTELDEEFAAHITEIADNAGLKLNFDSDDEENYENICKLFSLLEKAFLKKDIYFYRSPSEYRKKIDAFFNNNDFISLKNELIENKDNINEINEENKEHKIVNEKLLICMEKLKSFFKDHIESLKSKTNLTYEKENNIVALGERLENLEKLIVSHDKIRIVVYGTYNAGKSSTLNSLIGKDLLQVSNGQCTGKPILIRYSNTKIPEIYRAELKSVKDYDRFTHYAFIEKGKALAKGDEAVRDFINSQNNFVNNGKDKTDDFFILKTPIKILDELDLSEEIKNNVEFLDTPGLNIQNASLMKNNGELLEKLVEQTFIYIFIIDPKVGGTDTNDFKNILENTLLKTIYNRNIINDSLTFPYLFICNKCDNENIEVKLENCNANINSILSKKGDQKLMFDIIKFSALKRRNILKKMEEYSPENFIEKVENDFFNVLYSNSKTFYDYLDDYILKDFKKNFIGQINPELKEDIEIKDKIKEVLKNKNYAINNEKDKTISKLSGYLSFCKKNFKYLKIADNKMMEELKNKIKTKINLAYDYITNGYKNHIKAALESINNFIKIGIIADSNSSLSEEEKTKNNQKILSDLTQLFENNNIPETLKNFRQTIENKIESNSEIKYDYSNYEEVIKNKENFINNNLNELQERTIPNMAQNINNGILGIIEKIFDIQIYFEDGKMKIKENPSTKEAYLKAAGSLALSGLGAGAAYYLALVGGEQIVHGLIFAAMASAQPGFIALTILDGSIASMVSSSMIMLGGFTLGIGFALGGIALLIKVFGDRKEEAYKTSIKNMREKFLCMFDGYEKKINQSYYAKKEKTLEDIASFLKMCYNPIQLDENQKQYLYNQYNYLKEDIMNIITT